MNHEEKARKLKQSGYNCSESLYQAFADDTVLEKDYPAPRSIEGKCGALLTAMKIVQDQGWKKETLALEEEFQRRFGYKTCIELMRHERRCNDYVGEMASLLDVIFQQKKSIK